MRSGDLHMRARRSGGSVFLDLEIRTRRVSPRAQRIPPDLLCLLLTLLAGGCPPKRLTYDGQLTPRALYRRSRRAGDSSWISVERRSITAIPVYTVLRPWRR